MNRGEGATVEGRGQGAGHGMGGRGGCGMEHELPSAWHSKGNLQRGNGRRERATDGVPRA